MLRSSNFGAHFSTPILKLTLEFLGYAYVDDTDQVETLKVEDESTKNINLRMQQAVDMWEASIKSTGGAICPRKCNCFVLDFIWEGSTWRYATNDDIPVTLTIKDTYGIKK